MNSEYSDLFGGGAPGQETMSNDQLYRLRAMQQMRTQMQNPNYHGGMLAAQIPGGVSQQQISFNQQLQLLQEARHTAEYRQSDNVQQRQQLEMLQRRVLQQQMQHQQQQQHLQPSHMQPQQQQQQQRPRTSPIIPHKAPSHYPYQQQQMHTNSSSPMSNVNTDMPRPLSNNSQHGLTPSPNQQHIMDYSSQQQHQAHRTSLSQPQSQVRDQTYISSEVNMVTAPTHRLPGRYVPLKTMPASQPASQSQPVSQSLQGTQQPLPAHSQNPQQSPHDLSQPHITQPTTTASNNNKLGLDLVSMHQQPEIHNNVSNEQTTNRTINRPPHTHIPFKMDSMAKNKAAEQHQQTISSAHNLASNSETLNQMNKMDTPLSDNPAQPTPAHPAQQGRKPPPSRIIPFKMNAMRRQQKQQKESSLGVPSTTSSNQGNNPPTVPPLTTQVKQGVATTTAKSDKLGSQPPNQQQQKPKVSPIVPFKVASMKKSKPPIAKHAPFKTAPMKKATQRPIPAPPAQAESSSSSSGSSSSSSSSSEESGDEEKQPKEDSQKPVNVSTTQTKMFHPPRGAIPFKTAGNHAPKTTSNVGPQKKPMGKPLSMIKEKLAKENPGPPKPKPGGKPDSMLKMLQKDDTGERSNQTTSLPPPPPQGPKKRGRPPKSTAGKSPKQKQDDSSNDAPKLTRSDSQFEAISDSGSPDRVVAPKRKRGRPPKNKGKETPSQAKESSIPDSPGLPSTPAFEMPPTPRFVEPPPTPQAFGATTPMTIPPTPNFPGDSVSDYIGAFTPHQETDQPKIGSESPQKRGRGRPKKHEEDHINKSDEHIMNIVNDVAKSLKNHDETDDAPFDLNWTPAASTRLPSYTPTPASTPFQPPSGSLTPFPPYGSKTPFTPHGNKTPFTPHGNKTPFTPHGNKTPFTPHGSKTPLPSNGPSNGPQSATAPVTNSAPPTTAAPEVKSKSKSNSTHQTKPEENKKENRRIRKKGRRNKPAPEPVPETDPMEQDNLASFFSGLNDLPPMDVSGQSFRLDSRVRKPESFGANQDLDNKATGFIDQENKSAHQNEAFNALNDGAPSDKPGADDGDDIRLPPPDAQFHKGKKKKKKRESQKPYKRPGKIKHLDPVFIADMEQLSKLVESCCLYEAKQEIILPMYIKAFGEYALVEPPVSVPKPVEESQTASNSSQNVDEEPKAAKLKIKVNPNEIKPPSFDEGTEGRLDSISPDKEQTTPIQSQPTPLLPVESSNIPTGEDNSKKVEDDTKENNVTKPSDPKYDASLSAPEVAQKYFVQRPRGPIATKSIRFNKSKTKKPKFGKGSSPRSNASPHLSDPDLSESDRRQLPSRRSRPQQFLVGDEKVDDSHDGQLNSYVEAITSSPSTKRGRGRPPKSETEIPRATNLVRTNEMSLPLKKRHKMMWEDHTDELPTEPTEEALGISPADIECPLPERPSSSQSRKRPASSLDILGGAVSQDILDTDSRKKKRIAADMKSQQGSLSALQAAMEARLQNKVKLDKQQRKNPSPTKKAFTTSQHDLQKLSMESLDDEESSNDSSGRPKGKDPSAKKKSNKSLQSKSQALQYKKINKCVYSSGVKPLVPAYEPHGCACKKPEDPRAKSCHEDCLNRIVYIECTPQTCPCGDQCANMRIQKQTTAHGLEKIQTTDRGFGVKTTNLICAGEFILEYTGEVVTIDEFRHRMAMEYARDHHHYCLTLDSKFVIDGYRMGNIGRFVNHSCNPNCEMQKWNVNGVYRIGLFALKDISPGEELTYDYNFKAFNMDAQQKCHCGSSNCRGLMGGKSQNLANIQKTNKKRLKGATAALNPKDPRVRHQRAIMMPLDLKKFVRSRRCFLIRNLLSPISQAIIPKKTASNQPFKTLLPFKTDEKVPYKEYKVPSKEDTQDEEVIRCICGVLREEGDMLMCDKCEVWQHCDCVKVKPDVESYLCERCSHRKISGEVEMIPPPPDGIPEYKYYLSLEHGNVHVAIGDSVYMTPSDPNLGIYSYRIERLWKDTRGDKYVYGYFYYLPWKLPNRTDTTKKFYPNEVVQTMLYDILPLRNVRSHCYVVDEKSYCQGRPKDYTGEKDIFICEYRMDKLHKELKKITNRRETEQVNKFHYAFSYFKRPIKLTQYHSHVLKKAYDAPKKEVRQAQPIKPKKKSRLCSVENVVKTLAGKTKLALVDVNSITKKINPVQPESTSRPISMPIPIIKPKVPGPAPQPKPAAQSALQNKQSSLGLMSGDILTEKEKIPTVKLTKADEVEALNAINQDSLTKDTGSGKSKAGKDSSKKGDEDMAQKQKDLLDDSKFKKDLEQGRRLNRKKEARKPPEKRQAYAKGRKGRDSTKVTKDVSKPSASSLPRIPKKKAGHEEITESTESTTPTLRRGRSSSLKTADPPNKNSESSKPSTRSRDKSDAKATEGSQDSKSKDRPSRSKVDVSANSSTKDVEKHSQSKAQTSETPVKASQKSQFDESAKLSMEAVLKLQKIDKIPKVTEPAKKVQITISPKDGSNTSTTNLSGNAKSPTVHVKTPIVVKRTEPGKPPILSDLLSGGKGHPQNSSNQSSVAGSSNKRPRLDSSESSPTDKSNQSEDIAQIQKRGILKNALSIPVVRLSPVTSEETAASKEDDAEVATTPASQEISKSDTETPASPPAAASNVEEPFKAPTIIDESPASPTQETPASPIQETPASPIQETPASPVQEPVKPVKPVSLKAKRVVDIAEVLKRGQLAKAKEKEEKEKAAVKAQDNIVPKIPSSPAETVQPASPKELQPLEASSPTLASAYKAPKVIPLIPLSPTRESVQEIEPKEDSIAKDPIAIPLSPSAQENTIPLSPTQSPVKASSIDQSSNSNITCIIPLSPTSAGTSHLEGQQRDDTKQIPAVEHTQAPSIPSFLQEPADEDDSDSEPMLSIAEDLEITPVKKTAEASQAKASSDDSKDITTVGTGLEHESQAEGLSHISTTAKPLAENTQVKASDVKRDEGKGLGQNENSDQSRESGTESRKSVEDTGNLEPVFGPQSIGLVSGDSWLFSSSLKPVKPPTVSRQDSDDSSDDEEDGNTEEPKAVAEASSAPQDALMSEGPSSPVANVDYTVNQPITLIPHDTINSDKQSKINISPLKSNDTQQFDISSREIVNENLTANEDASKDFGENVDSKVASSAIDTADPTVTMLELGSIESHTETSRNKSDDIIKTSQDVVNQTQDTISHENLAMQDVQKSSSECSLLETCDDEKETPEKAETSSFVESMRSEPVANPVSDEQSQEDVSAEMPLSNSQQPEHTGMMSSFTDEHQKLQDQSESQDLNDSNSKISQPVQDYGKEDDGQKPSENIKSLETQDEIDHPMVKSQETPQSRPVDEVEDESPNDESKSDSSLTSTLEKSSLDDQEIKLRVKSNEQVTPESQAVENLAKQKDDTSLNNETQDSGVEDVNSNKLESTPSTSGSQAGNSSQESAIDVQDEPSKNESIVFDHDQSVDDFTSGAEPSSKSFGSDSTIEKIESGEIESHDNQADSELGRSSEEAIDQTTQEHVFDKDMSVMRDSSAAVPQGSLYHGSGEVESSIAGTANEKDCDDTAVGGSATSQPLVLPVSNEGGKTKTDEETIKSTVGDTQTHSALDKASLEMDWSPQQSNIKSADVQDETTEQLQDLHSEEDKSASTDAHVSMSEPNSVTQTSLQRDEVDDIGYSVSNTHSEEKLRDSVVSNESDNQALSREVEPSVSSPTEGNSDHTEETQNPPVNEASVETQSGNSPDEFSCDSSSLMQESKIIDGNWGEYAKEKFHNVAGDLMKGFSQLEPNATEEYAKQASDDDETLKLLPSQVEPCLVEDSAERESNDTAIKIDDAEEANTEKPTDVKVDGIPQAASTVTDNSDCTPETKTSEEDSSSKTVDYSAAKDNYCAPSSGLALLGGYSDDSSSSESDDDELQKAACTTSEPKVEEKCSDGTENSTSGGHSPGQADESSSCHQDVDDVEAADTVKDGTTTELSDDKCTVTDLSAEQAPESDCDRTVNDANQDTVSTLKADCESSVNETPSELLVKLNEPVNSQEEAEGSEVMPASTEAADNMSSVYKTNLGTGDASDKENPILLSTSYERVSEANKDGEQASVSEAMEVDEVDRIADDEPQMGTPGHNPCVHKDEICADEEKPELFSQPSTSTEKNAEMSDEQSFPDLDKSAEDGDIIGESHDLINRDDVDVGIVPRLHRHLSRQSSDNDSITVGTKPSAVQSTQEERSASQPEICVVESDVPSSQDGTVADKFDVELRLNPPAGLESVASSSNAADPADTAEDALGDRSIHVSTESHGQDESPSQHEDTEEVQSKGDEQKEGTSENDDDDDEQRNSWLPEKDASLSIATRTADCELQDEISEAQYLSVQQTQETPASSGHTSDKGKQSSCSSENSEKWSESMQKMSGESAQEIPDEMEQQVAETTDKPTHEVNPESASETVQDVLGEPALETPDDATQEAPDEPCYVADKTVQDVPSVSTLEAPGDIPQQLSDDSSHNSPYESAQQILEGSAQEAPNTPPLEMLDGSKQKVSDVSPKEASQDALAEPSLVITDESAPGMSDESALEAHDESLQEIPTLSTVETSQEVLVESTPVVPDESSQEFSGSSSQKAPNEASQYVPNEPSFSMPDESTSDVHDGSSQEVAVSSPHGTPDETSQDVPNESTTKEADESSQEVTDSLPQEVQDEAPHDVPNESSPEVPDESAPEIPDSSPQKVPNQASQDVPNEPSFSMPDESTPDVHDESSQEVAESSPHETPDETSQDVPDDSTPEVPDESSQEIPDSSPQEAPNEISQDAPNELTPEVRDESSQEIPDSSPQEAPNETSQDAPDESTPEAPDESSQESPDSSAQEASNETSQDAPDESTPEVPDKSSQEIPDSSPQEAPNETSQDAPDESTPEVPDESSQEIPDSSPQEAPNETSQDAPDELTPEVPDESSQEIPDSSPQEAPNETSQDAPDESTPEAPDESSQEIPEEAPNEASQDVPGEQSFSVPDESAPDFPDESSQEVADSSPHEILDEASQDVPDDPPHEITNPSPQEAPDESALKVSEDSDDDIEEVCSDARPSDTNKDNTTNSPSSEQSENNDITSSEDIGSSTLATEESNESHIQRASSQPEDERMETDETPATSVSTSQFLTQQSSVQHVDNVATLASQDQHQQTPFDDDGDIEEVESDFNESTRTSADAVSATTSEGQSVMDHDGDQGKPNILQQQTDNSLQTSALNVYAQDLTDKTDHSTSVEDNKDRQTDIKDYEKITYTTNKLIETDSQSEDESSQNTFSKLDESESELTQEIQHLDSPKTDITPECSKDELESTTNDLRYPTVEPSVEQCKSAGSCHNIVSEHDAIVSESDNVGDKDCQVTSDLYGADIIECNEAATNKPQVQSISQEWTNSQNTDNKSNNESSETNDVENESGEAMTSTKPNDNDTIVESQRHSPDDREIIKDILNSLLSQIQETMSSGSS